jgi:hypothetical protein
MNITQPFESSRPSYESRASGDGGRTSGEARAAPGTSYAPAAEAPRGQQSSSNSGGGGLSGLLSLVDAPLYYSPRESASVSSGPAAAPAPAPAVAAGSRQPQPQPAPATGLGRSTSTAAPAPTAVPMPSLSVFSGGNRAPAPATANQPQFAPAATATAAPAWRQEAYAKPAAAPAAPAAAAPPSKSAPAASLTVVDATGVDWGRFNPVASSSTLPPNNPDENGAAAPAPVRPLQPPGSLPLPDREVNQLLAAKVKAQAAELTDATLQVWGWGRRVVNGVFGSCECG